MPSLKLIDVRNFILGGIDLEVYDGEFLVILGPTGSGKTTLLNVISGLIEYQGSVLMDGVPLDGKPPHKRGVGYLFQDLALFPHMKVEDNIAYGLKARGEKNVKERVLELSRFMRIDHLLSRYPRDLSGGEKQRVALARTLAPKPKILLLDEPLSSLDLKTAKYLRMWIKKLQKELGITTIYVTHNQAEAEELGDRIAVMYNGKIEQVGKPEKIFFEPLNEKVLEFVGSPNILDCESWEDLGCGLAKVKTGSLSIVIPHHGNVKKIAIPPKDVYISKERPPGPEVNRFRGRVLDVMNAHPIVKIKVEVGDKLLVSELPHEVWEELGIKEGDEVFLILKLRGLRILQE